jgi:Domain of unknown function (DUF4340)
MKKTLLYLLVLGVLGGAVWYQFFARRSDDMYDTKEAGFNIKDTAKIGRIFIADFENQTLTADRTDTGWVIDHKYPALRSMVRMILNTLYQQQALYPVNKSAVDNYLKLMSTTATKVEVYDRAGKVMAKFYVGSAVAGGDGTVMLMEGAKMPYIVHIQGFVGYLGNRFSTRIQDWRDRTVFRMPASEIKSVTINYFLKPDNSFHFEKNGDKYQVSGKLPAGVKPGDVSEHNANIYAGYFGEVSCEGFLNGTIGMDSIIRTSQRHSTIDLESIHGKKTHVEVFWMALNRRSKNRVTADPNVPDDFDTDRLYALINGNKDTVMIQQFVFKSIFRRIDEFYQKDPTKTGKPL